MTRAALLKLALKTKARQQNRAAGRIPLDEGTQLGLAAVNKNLAVTESGLNNQAQNIRQSYGIEDTSNPFSRQALLRQNYERARSVGSQSLAARGQLYSGAQANAADSARLNYEQGQNALVGDYQNQLQGISQRRASAEATAQGSRADLIRQALATTLKSPPTAVATRPKINPRNLRKIAQRMGLH